MLFKRSVLLILLFSLSITTQSCKQEKNTERIAHTARFAASPDKSVQIPNFLQTAFNADRRSADIPASNLQDIRYGSSRAISAYDWLMKDVSRREGQDWRFLSAIAYHESRFQETVVSSRGAKGLMQIMPVVARQFDVPEEDVMRPEINVALGAKLLGRIEKSLGFKPGADPNDKRKIILACYNGGIGHVTDARHLARKYGYDPDRWEDVAYFLQLKADPEFHGDEVVKHGSFRGSRQTLAFVDNVMARYGSYCAIAHE